MKTLTAALILEKNKLYSDQPWVLLFEVDVDGTYANTLRLAAHPEDVRWNFLDWLKCPIMIEQLTEVAGGRLSGLNVHVANVDQLISAYVENTNLLGRTVTIYVVNRGELNYSTNCLSFTYRINRIQTTEESALFELGHEDLFAIQLPWQRYIRNKCRWVYKGDRCRYPGDEFEENTRQSFTSTGDGNKKNGWYALNMANAFSASIAYSGNHELHISTNDAAAYTWEHSTHDAPFVYKYLAGDFVARTAFSSSSVDENLWGFIVVSDDDITDWIGLVKKNPVGASPYDYVWNTTSGVTNSTQLPASYEGWKITRAGNDFTFSTGSTGDGPWTDRHTASRSDMTNTVKIGFWVGSINPDLSSGNFSYFLVDEGGLATCDLTLDGDYGCRMHHNEDNFGGFPSIPYGRLYGI